MVEYCAPAGDSTFTVRMPESGSVTVCVRAWNTFGCHADTCITIGATTAPVVALLSAQSTAAQTIQLSTPITAITYAATDATAVTVTGLPAGLNYTWSAPTLNITGTAAASATIGAHSYTVRATGTCGTVTTQGVITIAEDLFRMTTTKTSASFSTTNTGTMYVDWGDGTTNTYTSAITRKHTYTDTLPAHTITAQARKITYLQCSNNNLTELDVTQCPSLTKLWFGGNQVTELDVSKNTALNELQCWHNQLGSLDVSSNTALASLHCYVNNLLSLDLSSNTALTELYCHNNDLVSLDLPPSDALITLFCYNNDLTELDVSKNTKLSDLYCTNNPLPSLDVSSNTALTSLKCSNHSLTALNVSMCTALRYLECQNNQLAALTLPQSSALTYLMCYNNKLVALDLSSSTALIILNGQENNLLSLDVSSNTKLTFLDCCNNQLSTLNVSTNTALTRLKVQSNLFDAAALNALFGTLHTTGSDKIVYIHGNPKTDYPSYSGTSGCNTSLLNGTGWSANTNIMWSQ
jgi:hypothetical protein